LERKQILDRLAGNFARIVYDVGKKGYNPAGYSILHAT
jgi:hypothetical protein